MASSWGTLENTVIPYEQLSLQQIKWYTLLCDKVDETPPRPTPIPEKREEIESIDFYHGCRKAFEEGIVPPRNWWDVRRLWRAWTAPGATIPQRVRDHVQRGRNVQISAVPQQESETGFDEHAKRASQALPFGDVLHQKTDTSLDERLENTAPALLFDNDLPPESHSNLNEVLENAAPALLFDDTSNTESHSNLDEVLLNATPALPFLRSSNSSAAERETSTHIAELSTSPSTMAPLHSTSNSILSRSAQTLASTLPLRSDDELAARRSFDETHDPPVQSEPQSDPRYAQDLSPLDVLAEVAAQALEHSELPISQRSRGAITGAPEDFTIRAQAGKAVQSRRSTMKSASGMHSASTAEAPDEDKFTLPVEEGQNAAAEARNRRRVLSSVAKGKQVAVNAPSGDESASPVQAEKSKHSRQDLHSDLTLEAHEGDAGTSQLSEKQKKNSRLYGYSKIGIWQWLPLHRLEPLDKGECTVEELATTISCETNKYFSPEAVTKALENFRAGRRVGRYAQKNDQHESGSRRPRSRKVHPGADVRICNIIFNSEAPHLVPQVNAEPDLSLLKLHKDAVFALNQYGPSQIPGQDEDSLNQAATIAYARRWDIPCTPSSYTKALLELKEAGLTSDGLEARQFVPVCDKSLMDWGLAKGTDLGMLRRSHRVFITEDGYFDPTRADATTESLDIDAIVCIFGCGSSFDTLREATMHMFPQGFHGRCMGSPGEDPSPLPDCPFLLDNRSCPEFDAPITHTFFHLLEGRGVLDRCGNTFPTIFHAMKHLLDLQSSSVQHSTMPAEYGISFPAWLARHSDIEPKGDLTKKRILRQYHPIVQTATTGDEDIAGIPANMLFVTRFPHEIGSDEPGPMPSALPMYPPPGQPYTITTMRESEDLEKKVGKFLQDFQAWFSQKEAVHPLFQELCQRKDPVISFAFESPSHSFPLLPGPELTAYIEDVCPPGGNRENQSTRVDFVRALRLSMEATAHCMDLITQHPASSLPMLTTRADGFTCGLANLLHLIITTRSFKYCTLWISAHLLRAKVECGSPAFRDWESSQSSNMLLHRHHNNDSVIVEVESRSLGAAIMKQWRCERDQIFFSDAAFKPLLKLLDSRQEFKDQKVSNGRTTKAAADDPDSRSRESRDFIKAKWAFRDALMARLDTMMPPSV